MNEQLTNQMEETMSKLLKKVNYLDPGTKEYAECMRIICSFAEVMNTSEKDNLDYWDRTQRLELEKEKLEKTMKMEREKIKESRFRGWLDFAKGVTIAITGYFAYDWFQKRVIDFEEHGRITSTAGRELHLPKFFK